MFSPTIMTGTKLNTAYAIKEISMTAICPWFLRYTIHCFTSIIILKAVRKAETDSFFLSPAKLHQKGRWGKGGSGKEIADLSVIPVYKKKV